MIEIGLPILSFIIALVSFYIAYQARKEVKIQALFSGFQQANQATINDPKLLQEIHGLKDTPIEECKNIAYLSILMDAFQHEDKRHSQSTFLDNITSISDNKERWAKMKEVYYADFDKKFVKYIDNKFNDNVSKI